MKKALIVANWKMNKTIAAAEAFADEFLQIYPKNQILENVLICPPVFLFDRIKSLPVDFGAQDCSALSSGEGAYTGEISAKMLKDMGCKYVIIGHSERRKYNHESDDMIKEKIKNALKEGLKVILCIGESMTQREEGSLYNFLWNQVNKALPSNANSDNLIIAYEPIWAIGTGVAATKKQIEEIHKFLKDKFSSFLSIYGGSVTVKNAEDILSIKEISGLLIGGASLDPIEFSKIIKMRG